MRQDFAGLLLGKAVVHGAVEVVRKLRNLSRGYQRADGDKAAVTRGKPRPEPKIAKQNIPGVLDNAGERGPELPVDAGCAVSLRGFIEREELRRHGWKLICADLARGEYALGGSYRRHRIRPACVKSEMRDRLRELRGPPRCRAPD